MRFVHRLVVLATLVALGIGGVSTAHAAAHSAQAAVLGRQKIREELSAAMAKGYLSRMDQFRLLLHARDILAADDFKGFEQTLDHIAARQAVGRPVVTPARSGDPLPAARREYDPQDITQSNYQETSGHPVAAATGGEVVPTPGGNPFVEESPANIGRPVMQQQIEGEDPEACCDECEECRPRRQWVSLDFFSGIEAFKGPIDVGNANGNFGVRLGINGAVPIFQRMGIGLQAGLATDITNLEGSPYPEPNSTIRDQIFVTVGMFQRINRCDGSAFTWGFAYDYLFDDYYTDFHFGQWRVKGEYEASPWDAFGAQASLPDHGDTGVLPTFFGVDEDFAFKPITQGTLYWTHTFCNDATLTGRFGVAERPNDFVFGGESRVPLTQNLAVTGNYTYIMPNTGAGPVGQTQEIWNVSIGLEWVPGGFRHCCLDRFRPFIPVADNGSFAIRQTQ